LYKPIIQTINNNAQAPKTPDTPPSCSGDSCKLLEIGTQVLAIDDEPHDIERKKLLGVSNN
jgi:hypothetical protein